MRYFNNRNYHERSIGFWLFVLAFIFLNNMFCNEEKVASKEPCSYCQATGLQDCSYCYGKGTKDCTYCHGQGEKSCRRCFGSGSTSEYIGHHYDNGYQHVNANVFFGYYQVSGGYISGTCPNCDFGDIDCDYYECREGQVDCNVCFGKATQTCSYCYGEGYR